MTVQDMFDEARAAAFKAQPGDKVFNAACAVCVLRGLHPNSPHLGSGMLQWQGVVMEQALCKIVQEEVL